jgi:RND superfamily putative drug exporter
MGTTIAMGAAFGLSHFLPLSNLLQNIVMMIGLAIGIDYSLLMVSRFREALVQKDVENAVIEVVEKAGPAVLTSGLTVMIGLFGMTFAPLMELKSIGLGGSLVVIVSVLASLTLLPAILAMVGPWIDSPRWLARPLQSAHSEANWRKLAERVMNRPWLFLSGALIVVLLIAWPVTKLHTGFSSSKWLPPAMEAQVGVDLLEKMGNGNAVFPIYLIVRPTDGKKVMDLSHLPKLLRYAKKLQSDPRVGTVLSPVTLREGMGILQYFLLYRDIEAALVKFPRIGKLFLSRDRSSALFQVIPANLLPLCEAQQLAKDLARDQRNLKAFPFEIEVGGTPVYYNEFHSSLMNSYPPVILFVLGVTMIVLFFAFRSFLLPIKAVVLNLMSVAAGYGAVTMVFQFGWCRGLIGLERPLDSIPLVVPMVIFCIVFGLSMDYEVFLLSRIKEAYDQCGDNREATAAGLAATGSIITSAALIMVAVFGVFSWAEIAFIKIIGFGLTVAVLVDATLIRVLMAPAFMRLADRWNWVPGKKTEEQPERAVSPSSRG